MEYILKNGLDFAPFILELEKLCLKVEVKFNESMKKHTSFKIGGTADIFIEPSSVEELVFVIKLMKKHEIPYLVIGNGSNLLVRDEGVLGGVIKLGKHFSNITVSDTIITASCGAMFPVIGKYALENSLDGFYPLAGIPSTVGGGIVMNAGAYGVEVKDILIEVTVLNKNLEILILNSDDLQLGYRSSNVLENEFIVLQCKFQLKKGDYNFIKEEMSNISKKRRETQPLEYPSAGSTFKRPEGYFAGKLVEDCGLKGFSIGGAMVSSKHAGFLINYNNGTCQDMLKVIEMCQNKVKAEFNVDLELEVKVIGNY